MAADPSPLRYRTYLWFPVLDVGALAVATAATAADVAAGVVALSLVATLAGLYVAALLGLYGLIKDAAALAAADADWQPAPRRYAFAGVVVAVGLSLATVFPPVPVPDAPPLGPVQVVGTGAVALAVAAAPVCLSYLLVRWRRVGLNYL
jgi:hypothetical protein